MSKQTTLPEMFQQQQISQQMTQQQLQNMPSTAESVIEGSVAQSEITVGQRLQNLINRQSNTATMDGASLEQNLGSRNALLESIMDVNHPLGFISMGVLAGGLATVVGNVISDVVYDKTRNVSSGVGGDGNPKQVMPTIIVKNDPLVNIYKQRIHQRVSNDVIKPKYFDRVSNSL